MGAGQGVRVAAGGRGVSAAPDPRIWNVDGAFVPVDATVEEAQKALYAEGMLNALVRNFMPYDAYLRSEWWMCVRKAALERAGHRCQVCNASERLNVHHRTYEARGCESLDDLTVLCRDCHGLFHEHRVLA